MAKQNALINTSEILLGVGGLNWGLVEFVDFNLVDWLAELVNLPIVGTIVYGVVGISGVVVLYNTIYEMFNK